MTHILPCFGSMKKVFTQQNKTLFFVVVVFVYSSNTLTSTFANNEFLDKMQHNGAFHEGLYTVCKGKKRSTDKII